MEALEYRRLLKALPLAVEPDRDLFPSIVARLDARSVVGRRHARRLFPFAAAAGFAAVAIVAGWLGLQRQSEPNQAVIVQPSPVVLREARALRAEYDAALIAGTANQWAQLREQADPRLVAAWTELDAAEAEITVALEQDPDARFLFNRLRQVQDQRLRLTQKALSA